MWVSVDGELCDVSRVSRPFERDGKWVVCFGGAFGVKEIEYVTEALAFHVYRELRSRAHPFTVPNERYAPEMTDVELEEFASRTSM